MTAQRPSSRDQRVTMDPHGTRICEDCDFPIERGEIYMRSQRFDRGDTKPREVHVDCMLWRT